MSCPTTEQRGRFKEERERQVAYGISLRFHSATKNIKLNTLYLSELNSFPKIWWETASVGEQWNVI